MKLFIKILIITLSLSVLLKAEVVDQISISGNKRISDETIKVYGGIDQNKIDFSKQDIDNILKNIYETNFFENVSVEIKNKVLLINLKEYPVINQLVIVGEDSNKFKDEIKRLIQLKENNSYIKNNLNEDLNIIRRFYSSIGFNFAKISAKVRKIDERNLDLIFD